MSKLAVQMERQEDLAIIDLKGYLSGSSGEPLEDAFRQGADAQRFLVLFQKKDFINSAGLAILFDLVLAAKEQGKQVRVVHPSRHFLKVFRIMGLSGDVDLFETREQALNDWR